MLGEIMVKKGLLSSDNLRDALLVQQKGDVQNGIPAGERLGRVLLLKGFIDPMVLVRVLYEQKGSVDFLYVGSYVVEPRVVLWLPESIAEKHALLPLVSMDEETLIVASAKKLSREKITSIEALIKHSMEVVEVDDEDILSVIKRVYELFRKRGVASVRIGEMLVRDNYISQEDLDEALEETKITQRMLGRVLIEKGRVNEEDFFRILSLQKKLPLAFSRDILPMLDKTLVRDISKVFCLRNLIAPYKRDGGKVYLATAEPSINPDELAMALKCKTVDVKLMPYSDIEIILRSLYAEPEAFLKEDEREGEELEDIPIEEELAPLMIEDKSAFTSRYQKLTGNILLEAIKKGSSDIHIENYHKDVVTRFRMDGILYDVDYMHINKKNAPGVINVLKILSGMDIAERRLPQSGRFRKKTKENRVYDFRLQSQPTLYGENITIRILSQSEPLFSLDELGFSMETRLKYEKLIKNPSGLILITGPTGSGKTTTLYSTLDILRKDLRKKIITIEDPIEYSFDRVQQCQVKEDIGFSFARATRAFLREDPDILLVGEIRDRDAAMEAMRASQTGHLVFSTLHTNNTIETVQRLLDLDIDPGTIASELIAVVSQRLAKRNCPHCKRAYRPAKELLQEFYPQGVPKAIGFYKSGGCEKCNFRGHKGRVAVIEFWLIDMLSKQLIINKANYEKMYASAIKAGMIPMIKDAIGKAESGLIPLNELPDIIPYYEIVRLKEGEASLEEIGEPGGYSSP